MVTGLLVGLLLVFSLASVGCFIAYLATGKPVLQNLAFWFLAMDPIVGMVYWWLRKS